MKFISLVVLQAFIFCSALSAGGSDGVAIKAINPLDIPRPSETIVIKWNALRQMIPDLSPENVSVVDVVTGKELVSQTLDFNGDGATDELLFQWSFKPREARRFAVRALDDPRAEKFDPLVYCKFAVEGFDDMAWENDRVAFRMYGPAKEGTGVASGIDVWAKRVRYLILDKWYEIGDPGYHEDHGEGLDLFKVGFSRGCGGTAVWRNGKMYHSRVFRDYKIIANGPIRAIFQLSYAPWDAGGVRVSEAKRITIDAGQNLSRIETIYEAEPQIKEIDCAIGLVKRPLVSKRTDAGGVWMSLWGPAEADKKELEDLGTGVVIQKPAFRRFVETGDHILAICRARPGIPLVHYAGFGWTKSGDFSNAKDWNRYLSGFAQRLNAPIKVSLSKEN
ncbi:MAG: DUF4861 domain-containing protein [Armatimonadetes bacterium]|nr:DUF4861 domain-containing protein [Armatimonadota bacterium]